MAYRPNRMLLYQFTTYNLAAALFSVFVLKGRGAFVDIVRATSWLVLIASATIMLFCGHAVLLDIYGSLAEIPGKHFLVYLNDFVLHWLPAIVLGLPRRSCSLVAASLLLLFWYALVSNTITFPVLYSCKIEKRGYDIILCSVIGVGLLWSIAI